VEALRKPPPSLTEGAQPESNSKRMAASLPTTPKPLPVLTNSASNNDKAPEQAPTPEHVEGATTQHFLIEGEDGTAKTTCDAALGDAMLQTFDESEPLQFGDTSNEDSAVMVVYDSDAAQASEDHSPTKTSDFVAPEQHKESSMQQLQERYNHLKVINQLNESELESLRRLCDGVIEDFGGIMQKLDLTEAELAETKISSSNAVEQLERRLAEAQQQLQTFVQAAHDAPPPRKTNVSRSYQAPETPAAAKDTDDAASAPGPSGVRTAAEVLQRGGTSVAAFTGIKRSRGQDEDAEDSGAGSVKRASGFWGWFGSK
jgi:hypothetical protein